MKTFEIVIQGRSALLQHRFCENAEADCGKATRRNLVRRGTPREEAEKIVYRDKEGKFYAPGTWLARLICEAGGNHKLRGSRKSAKYVVPAAVRVVEEAITLLDLRGKPIKDFEVDSRPVVIPATKGRVMRHRPRFDEWVMLFHVRIDENILEPEFIHELLNEGGIQIGIGDFRPQKFGPFGTFAVTNWKEKNGNNGFCAKHVRRGMKPVAA